MRVDRRLVRAGIILLVALVGVVLTLPLTLPRGVRVRLVSALSERFDSQVQLDSIRVSVLPRLRIEGAGLILRFKGRTDTPPLIVIKGFSAEAGLIDVIGRPLRLRRVELDGLEINVPPGGMNLRSNGKADPEANDRGRTGGEAAADESPLIVDDLLSERAVLTLLRRTPGKQPRVFAIHHLSMQDTGSNVPWAFRATLTNPTPPGRIVTHGTFGPWNTPRPSATPLKGEYEFHDAQLSVFEGIRGTLASTGAFEGMLERIQVDGRAVVPDFALADVGRPIRLETRFHSVVDGTSGNTWLKPVDAEFLGTAIRASGGVVERRAGGGRVVTLDVEMPRGRIEDILRLVARTRNPPMTGAMTLRARFVLPPGRRDVIEKIDLNGSFEIARARFTRATVQEKIKELSQKARPGPEASDEEIASNFKGRFAMSDGIIRIPKVTFSVPGARVDVGGLFTLQSGSLDFKGTVRLDAKLSQMTTGPKSLLLKLVDPLFRRDNVTVIPVTVKGTVDQPRVRLDVGRTFTRE